MEKRNGTITKLLMGAMLLAGTSALTSCGVYDDTDDCRTALRVAFRYDRNMAFGDAFSKQVKSVHLLAFDKDGRLALDKTDNSAALAQDGYLMPVDELHAGTEYTFVVWAEGEHRGDSYTFGKAGTEADLTAKVNSTAAADGTQQSETDLTPLFHAREEGQTFPFKYGTTQTVTLPLTKDTKKVTVILQQQDDDATDMNPDDYTLNITADNGLLAHDNQPVSGNRLTYSPWNVSTGQAGVDADDTQVGALVARFTLNRLMTEPASLDKNRKVRLTVRNRKTDKLILSVPLIDYFLLVKDNYGDMTDQEYLDRQDTYNLTFFISHGKWLSASIFVNGWRVVPPQESQL